ncbi:TetR family transcriptional regulator [Mycetocola sp. 2940]|uniref:TetR/AcrR family transcriptional regulator n=1 Tax=Mycetocola sp. 2940 TaxID=3156452 RepID=UPI003396469C
MPAARAARPQSARRTDPARRQKIITAALDVIASDGVAGASHRKIAAAADVPLGSMTYHFSGMDELLHEAFTQFSRTVSVRIEERMAAVSDPESAARAVVDSIEEDVFGSSRDLVLTHELYTLAARDPSYRALTNAWMTRSRAALEKHFDPQTARILDATVEGLAIHRALDTTRQPEGLARDAVRRILAGTF